MKRLYTLPQTIRRRVLLTILFLTGLWFSLPVVQAQQSTFFENFDEAELGQLPDGFTAWQNGGGGNTPSPVWAVLTDGPWGVDQYVMSMEEYGRDGMTDEDWMITPQITPQHDDFLIFNTRRGYEDTSDQYRILISTTTPEAPAAFTEVFADYDMYTMPAYVEKFKLDLSAYEGVPIYIAFVHVADVGSEGYSGFWYIDDLEVRPIQQAFIADAYFRQATSPPKPPVTASDPLIMAGSVQFLVNGDYGTANISSITFSTEGTTDVRIIKEMIIYMSPWEAVTDEDILTGVIPVFGSVQNPGTNFEVTGSADLGLDNEPFFYFRYILNEDYTITAPYPQIDISVEKYVANGVERLPAVSSYFGAMDVVPPVVINDNFADAIQLAATPARYWSSTLPATYEPAYDKLAYCHNAGNKNVHSVWWYFVAPSDGLITADLSDSRFNSLLALLDENFNQLACNDDINDSNTASRVADLPVRQGQKIYVRVSDLGATGANQYNIAGVVALDFSFSVLTGTTPEFDPAMLSLYPNPTSGEVTVVLEVKQPGNVAIEITDVMGRKIRMQTAYCTHAGKNEVSLSLAGHPAGTYLVKVLQGNRAAVRKLSFLH